jgi:hypothetical protein
MAIVGNFEIGGKSFAKKSKSASPKTNIKEVTGGDDRSNYIANQAFRAQQKQQQQQQNQLQKIIDTRNTARANAIGGIVDPNMFKNQAARLPGESPEQYQKFMSEVQGLNPEAFNKAFPVSSGNMVKQLSRFLPGMNMLQGIMSFINKNKAPTEKTPVEEKNEVVTQSQAFRNIPENIHEGLQSLAMQPDFSQPAPFEEVFRIPGVRGSIMTGNPTGGGVPVQMLGQFRDMYGTMNEPPYSNVFMNYADGGIASLYD